MSKKYFCTFADSRMKKSLKRIRYQADNLDFFHEIFIYDENNLDPKFQEDFKEILAKGSRGYGYWAWKPQIILQTFAKIKDGDILLYTDAGCHLNKKGIERLEYYFKMTELTEIGFLVFQEAVKAADDNLTTSYSHLEKKYTKGDIFDHFNVRDDQKIYNTGIVAATTFVVRKCARSEEILRQWLDVFINNFNLVDDSPSISPNFNEFIENRHDQSIFSLLCKTQRIPSISAYEIWQQDWRKLEKYPILAKRDKELTPWWFLRQKFLSVISKIRNI